MGLSLPKLCPFGSRSVANQSLIATMIAIGLLFVRILCDCFKSRQQLEAEIMVLLRHQLNVLQPGAPCRAHLPWADATSRRARPRWRSSRKAGGGSNSKIGR